jgi:hypothetical protein
MASWVRGTVFLACWSLLFQSFVAMVHVPPADGATLGIPAWELASICHVDVAPATVAHDGDRGNLPKPGDHGPICPICLGLHIAGTFVAPPPVALPLPMLHASTPFFEDIRRALRPSHRRLIQARAPPALV